MQCPTPGQQVDQLLQSNLGEHLPYLLFLPRGYGRPGHKWPLILFLHGAGERGQGNLEILKRHGPPRIVEQNRDFPFIVASPQCPLLAWWNEAPQLAQLVELLDELTQRYDVDRGRVYLTGLSMGGFGAWTLACTQPERFAAMAAICGGGPILQAARLKDLPIWAFHGEQDEVVPLSATTDMVDAVRLAGGDVRLTIYPGVGHDSWTKTYDNPELYAWLLGHSLGAD